MATASWQVCRWEFLIFSGLFKLVLSVHSGEGGPRCLVFRLVRSSFMRAMEGRWQASSSPAVAAADVHA